MLAGNAKRIFCDNVTCFGTNESCWNRSHLPEFFIKAPHFLLAWLLCFFTQTPRFYIFLGGDLCKHPRLSWPEQFILWLGKSGLKNVICLFGMASSRVLFVFRHGVETSNLGDVSAQELCQAIKATHMMSIRPKMQEARKKVGNLGHLHFNLVSRCSKSKEGLSVYRLFPTVLGITSSDIECNLE